MGGHGGQLATCAALRREAVFHGRKSKGARRSPVLSERPKKGLDLRGRRHSPDVGRARMLCSQHVRVWSRTARVR